MRPIEVVSADLPELEDALAGAIAEARAPDPLAPVTVLVGHVLLRPYLRRMFAARDVPLLNVRFLQPHQLARELADGGDDRPRLSTAAERLLVQEIAAGAVGYFSAIAGRDGFSRVLRRLFRDLDMGGFTPESFERAAQRVTGDAAAEKLPELVRLYRRYVERSLPFARLPEHYRAAEPAGHEGPLLVYGLWSQVRELDLALVRRVADVAPVTVFVPSSGSDADEAQADFRRRLAEMGATASVRAPREVAPLDVVACRLFRPPAGEPVPFGDDAPPLELVSAPDTVREVWEAARTCLRWASEGIAFHEMAIVYRNADPYHPLVDEIFTEAGIPTYLHDGRVLSRHPLGRRLLALLEIVADASYQRVKVMEFLTETRVSKRIREEHDFRPSRWEALTREAGIVEGAQQWDRRLDALSREKRERAAEDERFAWQKRVADDIDVFRAFVRELFETLQKAPREASWAEHLIWLRDAAADYAAGTEPIVDALDDLRTLSAVSEPVSFEVFCRAVRDDLDQRDATAVLGEPVRQFGRHGVAVLDASSVRHLRFRAVYLLGAAERAWPPPTRPDPLLLERERRALNDGGDGRLPLRTEPDDEPLTFWLATRAARERLVASYARADAGKPARRVPSYFMRALLDAVEGRRHTIDDVEASRHVRRIAAGRLAADEPAQSVTQAEYDRTLVRTALTSGDPRAVAALQRASTEFARAARAREQRWSHELTAHDGVLLSDRSVEAAMARSPFGRGETVSPSRLEEYATCPYRFFMRYVLHIDPVEEPEATDRIDALERGHLIHAILERFLRECGDDTPCRERRDAHVARLIAVARAEEREREDRGVTGLPLLWKIDRRRIEEDLARWYDIEVEYAETRGMRPLALEARFGPAHGHDAGDPAYSTDEPLLLTVDGRTLRLQGRIDRIDRNAAGTRFRVIDYKTGRPETKGVFRGGTALQLPIYLLAAARMLEMGPQHGDAEYFFASSKGGFKRHTVAGDLLVAEQAQFDEILATIAGGIERGMHAPNPGKGRKNCDYCDYRTICDVRIERIMQRKDGDPRAAQYRRMLEIE